jgi:hypothetical protein
VVKINVRDSIICLLVAIAIAAVFIAVAFTNPPWLSRIPEKWQKFWLLTVILWVGAVSQYRHAWSSRGFWILLFVLSGVHIAGWTLALRSLDRYPPFPAGILLAGLEGIAFAASVYWLLGIPPPLKQK